jgi:hypothetical protein
MDNVDFEETRKGHNISIPRGSKVASARFPLSDGIADISDALRQLAEAWSDHFQESVPWDQLQIIAATYTAGVTIDFIVPPREG